MLDTKTFITRVTANQDDIVICVHRPDASGRDPRGIFWNRGSFSDIDEAVAAIAQWDAEPNSTVYFTVGRFAGHEYTDDQGRQKYRRRQVDATAFKALAFDLDIGSDKPYATQKEGWLALKQALTQIGLPQPMVVSSGNGIHCYWPLTQVIGTDHWVKASMALRLALEQNGVEIDTSKIHDPSMVLRPVGSHHKKQIPWKLVECKADCPDFEPVELFAVLRPWFGKAVSAAPVRAPGAKPKSSVMSAVLGSGDVVLESVLKRCNQLRAIADSGGLTDAAGNRVEEPMWRATMGLAKYCNDVPAAVIRLAGKHPDFDLDASMEKIAGWNGTGPTTCAKFEQFCGTGCTQCIYKSEKLRSPAQLSGEEVVQVPVQQPSGFSDELAETVFTLPKPYIIQDHKVVQEVEVETKIVDANGNEVAATMVERQLICNYEIHVTGIYTDISASSATATLAVRYERDGWKFFDMPMTTISIAGRDFADFLMSKLILVGSPPQQERLRQYIMRYLEQVQQQAPSGAEFTSFGWQEDGSFLCGETLVNSPTGNANRRLKGAASRYAGILCPHGEREKWIEAMSMLDTEGADNIRAAVLIATAGLLGRVSGNSSFIMSIYSTKTTTGKSLALAAANSLIGSPDKLLLGDRDTANALYNLRGTLNNLPATMDEMTMQDGVAATSLAYNLSLGREKIAMTKNREIRDPVTWEGPTLITTNQSLHSKYDEFMSQNEAVKARCLEVAQNDRIFIGGEKSERGTRFYNLVDENNGWAMPELAEAVVAMGGPKVVWDKGLAAFEKRNGFDFAPPERFYKSAIISGWIIGNIGKRLGLFPFDVDATIKYLCSCVDQYRQEAESNRQDAFDIIGQFLQEHNDQLIECKEEYAAGGKGQESVQFPVPDKAVARIKVVHDAANPVMPGSSIAINQAALKKWLLKTRDSLDRITSELESSGALIAQRERVTLFKGCHKSNPGQAFCVVVNLNHPRFIEAITSPRARPQSPISLAVLHGVGS